MLHITGNIEGDIEGLITESSSAGCRVFNAGNQIVSSRTWKELEFTSYRWDMGGFFTSGQPTRLTIPDGGDGIYIVGGSVVWGTNSSSYRMLRVYLNGSTSLAEQLTVGIGFTRQSVTTVYQLGAGDYVTLSAYHDTGAALDVIYSSNKSPEFWLQRVG